MKITAKMREAFKEATLVACPYAPKATQIDGLIGAVLDAIEVDEDAVERGARIIAPSSWAVFDGYLADVKRKYKGQDAAYDPDAFKDRESMALARAALTAALKGDE